MSKGIRYQSIRKLGEGGMASVYLARDTALNREVVVKLPHRLLLRERGFAERFRREVHALAALSHPHIVQILDVGEHNGCPFAVLQYLTGGTLEDLPHPLESIGQWLPPIATALDFIHERGYVHRDVKPSNILFDDRGNAVLADFGIAKAISEKETKKQLTLTGTGLALGTPDYMAPELAMGKPCDGRADQYALASVLYELYSGKPVFSGETPVAVMMKHASEVPDCLRSRDGLIPTALSDAISTGLAKNPADRHPNCQRLADCVIESNDAFMWASENCDLSTSQRRVASVVSVSRSPNAMRGLGRYLPSVSLFSCAITMCVVVATVGLLFGWAHFRSDHTVEHVRTIQPDSSSHPSASQAEVIPDGVIESERSRPVLNYATDTETTASGPSTHTAARVSSTTTIPPERSNLNAATRQSNDATSSNVVSVPSTQTTAPVAPDATEQLDITSNNTTHVADPAAPRLAVPDPTGMVVNSERDRAYTLNLGHGSSVEAMQVLSPDLVATAAPYGQVIVWDMATGTPKTVLGASDEFHPRLLAVSPRSSLLVAADHDGVAAWNLSSKRQVFRRDAIVQGDGSQYGSVLATTQNGNTVVFGTEGGVLYWIELETGAIVKKQDMPSNVRSAAFSPDGRELALGCYDSAVYVLDSADYEVRRILRGHDERLGAVQAVAYSPDGTLILSGSIDDTARLWSRESGKSLRVLSGHDSGVFTVAFCTDGRRALTGDFSGNAILWDLATGRELNRLVHPELVRSIAMTPDGLHAIVATSSTLYNWELDSGRQVSTFSATHSKVLNTLALSHNADAMFFLPIGGSEIGTWSCAPTRKNAPRIEHLPEYWDHVDGPDNGQMLMTYSPPSLSTFDPSLLSFHVDRGTAEESVCSLWDMKEGKQGRTFRWGEAIVGAEFTGSGRTVSAAVFGQRMNGSLKVVVWDRFTGTRLKFQSVCNGLLKQGVQHTDDIHVAFSDDGSKLLVQCRPYLSDQGAYTYHSARVFDLHDGTQQIFSETEGAKCAISSNGKTLVSESKSELSIWDALTGTRRFTISGCLAYALSSNGALIAAYCRDGKIVLCDVESGATTQAVDVDGQLIHELRFSFDDSLILGKTISSVLGWEVPSARLKVQLGNPDERVDEFCISGDSRIVGTSSERGVIRLWKVGTSEELLCLVMIANGEDWIALDKTGKFQGTEGAKAYVEWIGVPDESSESIYTADLIAGTIARAVDAPVAEDRMPLGTDSRSESLDKRLRTERPPVELSIPLPSEADLRRAGVHSREYADITFAVGKDADRVAVADGALLHLLQLSNSRLVSTIDIPDKQDIRSVAISKDGEVLAASGQFGVYVWRGEDQSLIRHIRNVDYATPLEFSDASEYLVYHVGGGVVRVADVARGKIVELPSVSSGGITDFAVHVEAGLVAAIHYNGTVAVWHIAQRRLLAKNWAAARDAAEHSLQFDSPSVLTVELANGNRQVVLPKQ